jgi:hypothetical protein
MSNGAHSNAIYIFMVEKTLLVTAKYGSLEFAETA